MELIRTKLEAVQTEGHAFTEQSMFAKMDVVTLVQWASCMTLSEQRASSGMFGSFVFFTIC